MPLARIAQYLDSVPGLPQADRDRLMFLLSQEEHADEAITFSRFFIIAPLLCEVILHLAPDSGPLSALQWSPQQRALAAVWPDTRATSLEHAK